MSSGFLPQQGRFPARRAKSRCQALAAFGFRVCLGGLRPVPAALAVPARRSMRARGLGTLAPGMALGCSVSAALLGREACMLLIFFLWYINFNQILSALQWENNLSVPQTASRNVSRRFLGLCTAKTCSEGNVTLHSDAPSWPREQLLLLHGLSSRGNTLLASLVHAWAGWRGCRCAGGGQGSPRPMRRPSSITDPPGKRSSCRFPRSVLWCLSWVWESQPGLQDGPWCLGTAGQGPPGAGATPVPQREPLLSLGQGRAEQSSRGPSAPSLQPLVSSDAFRVRPEKALLFHTPVSKLSLRCAPAAAHDAAA